MSNIQVVGVVLVGVTSFSAGLFCGGMLQQPSNKRLITTLFVVAVFGIVGAVGLLTD